MPHDEVADYAADLGESTNGHDACERHGLLLEDQAVEDALTTHKAWFRSACLETIVETGDGFRDWELHSGH